MKKFQTFTLRALQITTLLAIGGGIFFAWQFFLSSTDEAEEEANVQESSMPTPPKKVKRPSRSENISYEALLEAGVKASFQGNREEALRSFQDAAELEPRHAAAYEKIGDLHFEQKKYSEAVQNYSLAATLDPAAPRLKIQHARSLLGSRKIEDAKTVLEQTVPQAQHTLFLRGAIAAFFNDREGTELLLNASMKSGTDESLKNSATKILRAFRDFELARESKIDFLHAMLAKEFNSAGEHGLALEMGFQALKTNYNYRDVWLVMGHSFLHEKKFLDAEDALTKAVDLDATVSNGFFLRGLARKEQQKNNQARLDFEQALALGWQPVIVVRQHLAEITYAQGDFSSAFTHAKFVAITDPSDIFRFVRPMAIAIERLGNYDEALNLAQTAFAAHPEHAMAFNLLGWAHLAKGNYTAARTNLEEALVRDNGLESAYLNLGKIEEAEARYQKALQNYEIALKLSREHGQPSIEEAARSRLGALRDKIASGVIILQQRAAPPAATPNRTEIKSSPSSLLKKPAATPISQPDLPDLQTPRPPDSPAPAARRPQQPASLSLF